MFNDQKGVRISHSEIHIKDIQANVLYSVPITVKNISPTSKTIRFYPPQKQTFSLKVTPHEKTVAPGLDHSAVIEFQSPETHGFTDRLVVTVDGEVVEVPITVRPCEPLLSVVKEVDFGTMVMANKVVTKEILMTNNGSQPGTFEIVYHGDKPLNIVPSSGVVPPRTAQVLRIEYVVKKDHNFDETAQVSLEGQAPFFMRVFGSIVKRKLQLLKPNTEEEMLRVSMGATYYGTDKLEAAMLFNNGPEVIQFVSILVEDTVGQESGNSNANRSAECNECTNPLTSLVGMVPNQGTLGPYQKVPIFFRFSPRWKTPSKTFYNTRLPPPKQDFALFLRIQMVGGGESGEPDENDTKEANQEKNSVQIEVAITGTALPVLISVDPTSHNFGMCSVDQAVSHTFSVINRSDQLATHFEFQRIAHLCATPERGCIPPGERIQVNLSFVPKQIGSFNVEQPIHVMGNVGDNDNPFEATFDIIHTAVIHCRAECFSITTDGNEKYNPGIVPLITNEVGINVNDTRFTSLGSKPRMAMITDGATKATNIVGSILHMTRAAMQTNLDERENALIAFPNDRFQSIRPSEQNKSYRTVLRREERYNYIDPDYAYTAEEAETIRAHKEQYATKVRKYHARKVAMARDKLLQPFENELDLGIPPGNNVSGRLLKLDEIGTVSPVAKLPNQSFKLLSTKDIGFSEQSPQSNSTQNAFNVVPSTEQEKLDCRKTLTPQELHQIVAGPSTIDFGRVCLRSVTQRELLIVNHLNQFIHIIVDIGCRELRQSSPLSQVISPSSKASIPLIFESNTKGKFQRNVNYTINGHHKNHIIALAEVVPVDLTISPSVLELYPITGLSVEDGIRGIVTLENVLNAPAEFFWEPIFKSNKTAFSICPRSGIVDEFSSLDCEVVFYPSFDALDRGEFQLLVRGANVEANSKVLSSDNAAERHLLECRAHLGNAHTFFVNRRVVFGHIPLNLTTVKTAILQNNSSLHSYFRVLNPNPIPGMVVLPLTGAVPVGGEAQIKVSYLPTMERKVDCCVRVALRGGRELELRIAGNVIQPCVDILQYKFDFGGIYVGSKAMLPFEMVNQTSTRTLVEFDLARFRDFSIKFPDHLEDENSRKKAATEGIYSVTIKGRDKVSCQIMFRPTEVASYDFHLVVHINQMTAPIAAETPIPPTPQEVPVYLNTTTSAMGRAQLKEIGAEGAQQQLRPALLAAQGVKPEWHGPLIPPRPQKADQSVKQKVYSSFKTKTNGGPTSAGKEGSGQLGLATKRPIPNITPSRHVIATAIRQPLLLSTEEINFSSVQPVKGRNVMYPIKYLMLVNNLDTSLPWKIDLVKAAPDDDDSPLMVKVVNSSGQPLTHASGNADQNAHLTESGNVRGVLNIMGETVSLGIQFMADQPGKYLYRIPIYVKDDVNNAYTHLIVRGRVPGPKLKFLPSKLVFTPTPLNIEVSVTFYIVAQNYNKETQLEFEVPDIKADSGAIIRPLRFAFTDTNIVKPLDLNERKELACRASFKAEQLVNFNGIVNVSDGLGNRFPLTVIFSADNSILTTYSFMARHKDDYHIVCEEGRILEGRDDVATNEMGEAQILPLGAGEISHSRASTAATSSNFDVTNSSYEGTMSASETPMPSTPREGALVHLRSKYTGEGGTMLTSNYAGGFSGEMDLLAVDEEDTLTENGTPLDMISTGASGSTGEDGYLHPRRQKTPSRGSPANTVSKVGSAIDKSKILREGGRISSLSASTILERDWTRTTFTSERSTAGGKQHSSYHMEDLCQSHPQVVAAVQKWFSQFGWPGGPFPSKLPESFRSRLSRKEPTEDENRKERNANKAAAGSSEAAEKENALNNADWSSSGAKAEQRTLYDMLWHLSGSGIPGISLSGSLPPLSHPAARLKQVLAQHHALLQFLRVQGGAVCHITPQILMDRPDYSIWLNSERQKKAFEKVGGNADLLLKTPGSIGEEEMAKMLETYESESRRAWTDLLLQLFKTLILARVTPKSFRNLRQPDPNINLPQINMSPLASNCYSLSERILLAWLNHYYEHYRGRIWKKSSGIMTECETSSIEYNCHNAPRGTPAPRWIVNFENDLMDGLVLAAAIGAHMPFLVETHFKDMYTFPSTAEQCLHNCLKVVNAMRSVGLEFDIQALEMTSPHPIQLLMLTTYLYESLPQYIATDVVEFEGILHGLVSRQIKVSNPTGKPLSYRCILVGHDSRDFTLPKGDMIVLPPRGNIMLLIEFKSRYLRMADAYLLLVSKNTGPNVGLTLCFNLKGHTCQVIPAAVEKLSSPCYFLRHLELRIVNPFPQSGEFQVSLLETENENTTTSHLLKRFASRPSHLQKPDDFINSVGADKTSKTVKLPSDPNKSLAKGKQVQFSNAADESGHKTEGGEMKEERSQLLSFFCYSSSLSLQPHGHALLPLTFLPFQVGRKHCFVRLFCPQIGEFLHSIEATAELPLATPLPMPPAPKPGETVKPTARVTSAVAAARGAKGDDNIAYWRCEVGHSHTETLLIPVANRQKENALIMAAQQYLSEQEISRRRITGTLESNTLASKAMEMLTVKKSEKPKKHGEEMARKYDRRKNTLVYRVETSSQFFKVSETIAMPDPKAAAFKSDKSPGQGSEPTVELTITFHSRQAGVYPCDLIIKGSDDVRVHRIECMVVPEGSEAELHFHAPVHETVTQLIPLINMTPSDWPMKAYLQPGQAIGFNGPDRMIAKAKTTSHYQLKFRALKEGDVFGKLELINENDGTRHLYHLKGRGKKPLALDTIQLEGQVLEKINRILTIPNTTRRKLTFDVETDLPNGFLHGVEKVTVLPGRQVAYSLCVTPLARGHFDGIVAFVAGKDRVLDYDSDGDEIPPLEEDQVEGHFRMWYRLDINATPAPPRQVLELQCCCQRSSVLQLPLSNPWKDRQMVFQVTVEGDDVTGPPLFKLAPGIQNVNYELRFTPSMVRENEGSLIFFNEELGEFWYVLKMTSLPPPLTVVEPVECELGKWEIIELNLQNPSEVPLILTPSLSNSSNYSFRLRGEHSLTLEPRGTLTVPIRFAPSDLGFAAHNCRVTFNSAELGEWVFQLSGCGILPKSHDLICVTAPSGSNTTMIIPFHNPLNEPALVDVILTEAFDKSHLQQNLLMEEPLEDRMDSDIFRLLLKSRKRIHLAPKAIMDIPISFAPREMRQYDALCCVVLRHRDETGWKTRSKESIGDGHIEEDDLREVRWLFPIKGVPESILGGVDQERKKTNEFTMTSSPILGNKEGFHSSPPVIRAASRSVKEERLELQLAGVAPVTHTSQQYEAETCNASKIQLRQKSAAAVTNGDLLDGANVKPQMDSSSAETFEWDLRPLTTGCNMDLVNQSLQLQLLRQHRDGTTGLLVLTFSVVFKPMKEFRAKLLLTVRSGAGGVWKFPLKLKATEPEPDDVIVMRAVGIGKDSAIQIRLTSQDSEPAAFHAYFDQGSDLDFTITPTEGELPPVHYVGLPFQITFRPLFYGKPKQATLVVKTSDMEWSYRIIGELPQYDPPEGQVSDHIKDINKLPPCQPQSKKRNYIRRNMKFVATLSGSSLYQGTPIFPKV